MGSAPAPAGGNNSPDMSDNPRVPPDLLRDSAGMAPALPDLSRSRPIFLSSGRASEFVGFTLPLAYPTFCRPRGFACSVPSASPGTPRFDGGRVPTSAGAARTLFNLPPQN